MNVVFLLQKSSLRTQCCRQLQRSNIYRHQGCHDRVLKSAQQPAPTPSQCGATGFHSNSSCPSSIEDPQPIHSGKLILLPLLPHHHPLIFTPSVCCHSNQIYHYSPCGIRKDLWLLQQQHSSFFSPICCHRNGLLLPTHRFYGDRAENLLSFFKY